MPPSTSKLQKSNQIFIILAALRRSVKNQIKSSLYSPHYAEACNELRGPSPRLSAWATQLRRNVATVASRWRHCADLTGPGIEPQTSRTESVRFATELTAVSLRYRSFISFVSNIYFHLGFISKRFSGVVLVLECRAPCG